MARNSVWGAGANREATGEVVVLRDRSAGEWELVEAAGFHRQGQVVVPSARPEKEIAARHHPFRILAEIRFPNTPFMRRPGRPVHLFMIRT